jgi:hypothetical protein
LFVLSGGLRPIVKLFIALLLVAITSRIAAAALSSLLPTVGSSQTFAVTSHTDSPFHGGGPGQGPGGPGGPPPSGAFGGSQGHGGGNFRAFMRDESGTLTLKRDAAGSLSVTSSGDVDQVASPLTVTDRGTIDPGDTPDRFIVALDNAIVLASGMAAGTSSSSPWQASVSLLMPPGSLVLLPLQVKVLSSDSSGVKLEGTGTGTVMVSSPHGERPVDVNVTADEQLTAGRLTTYTQKIQQAIKTPYRTMNITNTVSLTSQ